MSQNPFIVIEALDAGGSQTQTDLLAGRLQKRGIEVLPLHFPQEDRSTGRLIYGKFLLDNNRRRFTRREQALLYIQDFYSQADNIREFLKGDGLRAAVSDRFCTSTFVYQTIGLTGAARKRQLDWLDWLCFKGQPQLPKPDTVIFIDTPVEVSLKRLKNKPKDFFETKAKLSATRRSYLDIARRQKWIVINGVDATGAERTRAELHEEIWQKLNKFQAPNLK